MSRKISTGSNEFHCCYVDYNIIDVDYWSTPFAKSDKKYRDFWVNYCNGRRLKFNLDEFPIRYASPKGGRWARSALKPRRYYKQDGIIYPEFYGEGSTPTLIDIATTIAFNHRQKEQFLEIAELTFKFAVILSAYAGTPNVENIPRGHRLGSRLPKSAPVSGGTARAGDAIATTVRMKFGKVGVNLGGTGEVQNYVNVNNLIGGQKAEAIPNLVKGNAEEIASFFQPNSVDHIVANNIVPGTIDWMRAADASYTILRKGGVIELAEFAGGYEKGINIEKALKAAKFQKVEIINKVLVRGVK